MKTKFNITDIHRVGVDLAKNVIQIYAVDKDNKKLMNRRFTRVHNCVVYGHSIAK